MTTKIMDSFKDPILGQTIYGVADKKLYDQAIASIAANNVFMPDITKIIFHADVSKQRPILATVVYFADNTKVTVVNSENDAVDTVVDQKTGVTTASDASKERALTYAICKKVLGLVEPCGNVKGNGLGRKLRAWVKGAWDQNVGDKLKAMEKAENQKKLAAEQKAAQAKPKRMSLAQAMDKLASTMKEVEELRAKVNGKSTAA